LKRREEGREKRETGERQRVDERERERRGKVDGWV
jgi:hypothetical protein